MVDVFLRNVNERVYRKFKARAAAAGVSLGEAFESAVEKSAIEKPGLAGFMRKTYKLPKKYVNASERVDEIIGEAIMNDYPGYKRSHSKRV